METKEKKYLSEIGRFTSFSFIGEVARYIFLLTSSAIVTNTFGAGVYGQYAFVVSLLTILITISGLGVSKGVIFYTQKFLHVGEEDKAKGIVAYAYLLVAAAGGLIAALVMIFATPISRTLLNSVEYAPILLRMAPLIVIEALFQLSLTVYRSRKRIARMSLVKSIYYHVARISIILLCFLVFGIKDVNGLIISTYGAYIFVLVYNLITQLKQEEVGKPSAIGRDEKKEVLLYSLPLFMSSIIGILLRQTDILMLGYITNEEAVAVYKISVQLCSIIPFINKITGTFFGPMISSLYHSGNKEDMKHTYRIITKWTFTVGLMIFLGIVFFGESALHLFGREFIYGHTALILVAVGNLAKVITGQSGSMNSMTGHTKVNLVTSVVTFVINVVLNLILIPKHGIIGAAIATLVSSIIGNFTSLIYLYITQKIQPYDITYLKPIVAGGVSYTVIYFINRAIMWEGVTDILIKGCIYVAVFAGSILLMKVDEDDKTILRSMIQSIRAVSRRKRR